MEEEIFIVLLVCVVLPVSIVLIISLRKRNSDNKRAEVLLMAIEAGSDVDTNRLLEALRNPKNRPYTQKEILYARLQRGCIFSLVGLALMTLYFLGENFTGDKALTITAGLICLAVGIAYLIVFFVTRNDVSNDK